MKISPEIAKQIWIPILARLRHERTEYNYRTALELSHYIRSGYNAHDMLDELKYVLSTLEEEGMVHVKKGGAQVTTYFGIGFENEPFSFTDVFDKAIKDATKKQEKSNARKNAWEHWIRPSVVGLVSGVIGGVIAWLITERMLK